MIIVTIFQILLSLDFIQVEISWGEYLPFNTLSIRFFITIYVWGVLLGKSLRSLRSHLKMCRRILAQNQAVAGWKDIYVTFVSVTRLDTDPPPQTERASILGSV